MFLPVRTVGAALILALVPAGAAAQLRSAPISDVRYDVTFDAEAARSQTVRVEMSFRTSGGDPVLLSLPAWTPGSYELDNFARYVVGFSATSGTRPLDWDKVDYDTWRVTPGGAADVVVTLEYRADTLDTGMAWSTSDFAYFNGTNVFLYPEGRDLRFPANVTIRTEPDWQVATGMTPAGAARRYRADDYHELVDMPTLIGRFDLDSARVDGHWYRLATYPTGAMAGETRTLMWDQIRAMMPPMSAVFAETPWDTYTIQMVFPAAYPGGSALEHRNSHLGIYTSQLIGSPILASVVAHEIFHAWNVKRLRPTQLVPYDYGRAQPTELLWMSEGITDYYADLALVRGGIVPETGFYQLTSGKINIVDATPPVALEDASLSTWIGAVDGTAYVYYPKGSLAGFLLDILIRDASDNRSSLDRVMRRLYDETYRNGRGFTTEEWWAAVRDAAAGRRFDEFAERYIDGREPFPWEDVLPLAGMGIVTDTNRRAFIGVSTESDASGIRVTAVTPGSSAVEAGVQPGDYLVRIGEVPVEGPEFGAHFRARYGDVADGTPLEIVVRRDGEEQRLQTHLRFREDVAHRIAPVENPSAKARRIREGILTGQ